MRYEISKNRDEILKTIRESNNKNKNILWQNHDDNRMVLEITDLILDPITEVIKFNVLEPKLIDKDKSLYIKLHHRNMIFKGSVVMKNDDGIFVQIPDQVKLEELREHKRYEFESTESRQVLLQVDSSIQNIKEHMKINLLDVSQSGIGIIVNPFDKDKVIRSSQINLSSLGYFEFKSHFTLNPVYKSSIVQRNEHGVEEHLFKIGFRFEELLPEKLLKDFIRAEENLFANEIGFLGKSRKFQKKLHREFKQMMKTLEGKKEFFEFFMGHGNIQSIGDEYMSKHIRLVSMFSSALARLLGWVDKISMAQLTYAAFVHDIAFFTNPMLAQIKDKSHFDRIKHLLNVNERELYFRSTKYPMDFCDKDPYAPAGAQFILEELHQLHISENPEYLLAKGDISPMTAIFLVAHDLVDYAVTHPRWTFYDYLSRYPFAAFGGTFELLFDELNRARAAA